MVRLRVAVLLQERGLTAYRLGRAAGITYPTAYRLARESGDFSRLERDTLNRLCEFFRVQPGELIEWVSDDRPNTEDRRTLTLPAEAAVSTKPDAAPPT